MTAVPKITEADYLALEAESDTKHEFVNGELIAMAGAEPRHNVVKEELSALVRGPARGKGCLSMSSDQRVKLDETGLWAYPDVVVVCGPPEFIGPHPLTLTNPSLVFEVLSPTTEAWDRGGKFAHFRQRPSLKAYVLVDPATRTMEMFTPDTDGTWRLTIVTGGGTISLPGIDLKLDADAVFAPLALLPEELR